MMSFTEDITTPDQSLELSPLAGRHLLWSISAPNPVIGMLTERQKMAGEGRPDTPRPVGKWQGL